MLSLKDLTVVSSSWLCYTKSYDGFILGGDGPAEVQGPSSGEGKFIHWEKAKIYWEGNKV